VRRSPPSQRSDVGAGETELGAVDRSDVERALRRLETADGLVAVDVVPEVMRRITAEQLGRRSSARARSAIEPTPGSNTTVPALPTHSDVSLVRISAAARAAFRQRRFATDQSRLHDFYVEHGLSDQARGCRSRMLTHLRAACRHWRTVLGAGR
jgi:hypothetical protein